MQLSYATPITDDETRQLAGQIVRTLVASGVTYQKANDTLSVAQEMLMQSTKPVMTISTLHSDD